MKRPRLLLVTVLSIAVLLVVGALVWHTVVGERIGLAASPPQRQHVLVITAPPVEPWVRAAAREFNAAGHMLEGAPIEVEVVPMDGLTALGKWERNEFNSRQTDVSSDEPSKRALADGELFPTAWIPDSRYLVDMANVSYRQRLGRDVFLSDGQYRSRSVGKSLLAWGFFRSRAAALQENIGEIRWSALHIAASAPTGWKELGGGPILGPFQTGNRRPAHRWEQPRHHVDGCRRILR